jgi:hypothetical protein
MLCVSLSVELPHTLITLWKQRIFYQTCCSVKEIYMVGCGGGTVLIDCCIDTVLLWLVVKNFADLSNSFSPWCAYQPVMIHWTDMYIILNNISLAFNVWLLSFIAQCNIYDMISYIWLRKFDSLTLWSFECMYENIVSKQFI